MDLDIQLLSRSDTRHLEQTYHYLFSFLLGIVLSGLLVLIVNSIKILHVALAFKEL